jgi:hypothetical protein
MTDLTMDYLRYKQMIASGEIKVKEEIKRMNGLENIVGKRINGFTITDDKTTLTFNDDAGALYVYNAEADCCSHSWIENVEDPEYLIGNLVMKVEEKEITDYEEDGCFIKIMGYDVYTDKGICKIDFRNSSNGFYGGRLQIASEENNPDPINGKTIKKMSWSNDGMTGTRIYFETDDGYVLTYLLGFKGDLKYLYTKDAG